MTTTKLNPCGCEGVFEIYDYGRDEDRLYHAICTGCGMMTPDYKDIEKLEAMINKATPLTIRLGDVKEMWKYCPSEEKIHEHTMACKVCKYGDLCGALSTESITALTAYVTGNLEDDKPYFHFNQRSSKPMSTQLVSRKDAFTMLTTLAKQLGFEDLVSDSRTTKTVSKDINLPTVSGNLTVESYDHNSVDKFWDDDVTKKASTQKISKTDKLRIIKMFKRGKSVKDVIASGKFNYSKGQLAAIKAWVTMGKY